MRRVADANYVGRDDLKRGRYGPLFPLFIILGVAAGYYLYAMSDRPWSVYLERLQYLLNERGGKGVQVQATGPAAKPVGAASDQVEPFNSPPGAIPQQETQQRPAQLPLQLDISIGLGFRPTGFKISAVPQAIGLSRKPGKPLRHLPSLASPQPWYGAIKLSDGSGYGFALDQGAAGYSMYLDRNRNGDLRDDGAPLVNQGDGLFATRVALPLPKVTGIPQLTGEYQLWLFTNPTSLEDGTILYYSMTQLQGELLLQGKRYTAFLADNGPVDGDYRNDGISIDLDADGKIERESEFFPPGKDALIDGATYRFVVTR